MKKIPFNYFTYEADKEEVARVCNDNFEDNGKYTQSCRKTLEKLTGAQTALLTDSCTNALEMAAILCDLKPGDEVIMPSYTFVTGATAFVMRGAVPVFVDCLPETMNIDPEAIETAITCKTKAIVVMHYAAIACDMKCIQAIAAKYNLCVIEDAAQCIGATYYGKYLGTFGSFGAISFHYTKNIHCGHGGCLLINDPEVVERAKVVWQKGTNRESFCEGKVDKYTWQDIGSSYVPSEFVAALLHSQLSRIAQITSTRVKIWNAYHDYLKNLDQSIGVQLPSVPKGCQHNGHMYFLRMPDEDMKLSLKEYLSVHGIDAVSHYVPLHDSPAGKRFGRVGSDMTVTSSHYNRLLRLPLWPGMLDQVPRICELISDFFIKK